MLMLICQTGDHLEIWGNTIGEWVPNSSTSHAFTVSESETGVKNLEPGTWNLEHSVYDLSGQKIQNPSKGVYIINGKKVLK